MDSLVCTIPADLRAAADMLLSTLMPSLLPPGGTTFAAPLSPTGLPPATHYGLRAAAIPETAAIRVLIDAEASDVLTAFAAAGGGGVDLTTAQAVGTALTWDERSPEGGVNVNAFQHFSDVIGVLGLARVGSPT